MSLLVSASHFASLHHRAFPLSATLTTSLPHQLSPHLRLLEPSSMGMCLLLRVLLFLGPPHDNLSSRHRQLRLSLNHSPSNPISLTTLRSQFLFGVKQPSRFNSHTQISDLTTPPCPFSPRPKPTTTPLLVSLPFPIAHYHLPASTIFGIVDDHYISRLGNHFPLNSFPSPSSDLGKSQASYFFAIFGFPSLECFRLFWEVLAPTLFVLNPLKSTLVALIAFHLASMRLLTVVRRLVSFLCLDIVSRSLPQFEDVHKLPQCEGVTRLPRFEGVTYLSLFESIVDLPCFEVDANGLSSLYVHCLSLHEFRRFIGVRVAPLTSTFAQQWRDAFCALLRTAIASPQAPSLTEIVLKAIVEARSWSEAQALLSSSPPSFRSLPLPITVPPTLSLFRLMQFGRFPHFNVALGGAFKHLPIPSSSKAHPLTDMLYRR